MNGLLREAHASIQLNCGLFEQLPGVEGPNTRRQPMQALEVELTLPSGTTVRREDFDYLPP
jgi:hypothetical protein